MNLFNEYLINVATILSSLVKKPNGNKLFKYNVQKLTVKCLHITQEKATKIDFCFQRV